MYTPCIYTSKEILDSGYQAANLRFSWNRNGADVCTFSIPNVGIEKLRFAVRQSAAMVDVNCDAGLVWRGRLSSATLSEKGVDIIAHGLQYEFDQVRIFHYWTHSSVADWVQAVDKSDVLYPFTGMHQNQKFSCDNNNRLYIALVKGNEYAQNDSAVWFLLPVHSPTSETSTSALWTRPVRRFRASYEMLVPAGFEFRVAGEHADNPPTAVDFLVWNSVVGTGSLQNGTIDIDVSVSPRYTVLVYLINKTGGGYTMAGETGDYYVRLTNIQVLTTSGANVYPSDIVANLVSLTATQRGISLFANNQTVENTGVQINHEVYQDVTVRQVIDKLAGYGTSTGRRCAWYIDNDYAVYLRQVEGPKREFVVSPQGETTIYNVRETINRTYAIYSDARGHPRRTAWVNDTYSQSIQGTTTTGIVHATTTSQSTAEQIATSFKDARRGIQSRITARNVKTLNGNNFPFWQLRAGDIIYNENELPFNSTQQASFDTLYLAGWEYGDGVVNLIAEQAPPSIENML